MKVRATVVYEWDEELSNWEGITDEDQMLAAVENYCNDDFSYFNDTSVLSIKVEKIP